MIASDNNTDYGNVILTGKELADVLGLSEAHVFTLRRRGVLQQVRAHKNQYVLGSSVRSYIQFKCGQDSAAEADYHKERALKERANRELREILVQQTRGQLHRSEDVSSIIADGNSEIRSRLLAFGNLLALQITGKTDPAQVKDIIDSQVRRVLNELRDYQPRDYYRRNKTRELESKQFPDKPQPEKEEPAFGLPGWPKGKPRGSSPHPWASAANKKRWATDPEALARTVQAMNEAKLASADKVHAKISRAAKNRWQRVPVEQKLAHMAKMRAARGRQKSVSGTGP
jgi:hypothetical protein